MKEAAVAGIVLNDAGAVVRGAVDVPVVAHRQHGLQAVAHHAGHGDGEEAVRLVVLKDVPALAMQQEHDGLQEDRQGGVS